MLPGKRFFWSLCGLDRRWGAAKCHGSAISPLPEAEARLVPAAWAVGEDEACPYLQQPPICSLLPLFLPPMSAGAASACARHPRVLEGFSWQEQPGSCPRFLPQPFAWGAVSPQLPQSQPLGPMPWHAAQSAPLHIPSSHFSIQRVCTRCRQSRRKELTRISSVPRKAHLSPPPLGRRCLRAFQERLWELFDIKP